METLYDLLGALPNDNAEDLRLAFRRAVKGTHPDLNPGDPDAGLKFRQIVRANELLADGEQRAAYDHLLALARLEREQAAKRAFAGKIYKLASGVMALAALSAATVGGYALFMHLSADAALPLTGTAFATREPAAIAAPEQPASIAPAPAETADPAVPDVGPPLDITPHTARSYWALGIVAYRSGDMNGALAAFDQAIQADPNFVSTHLDRGIVLQRGGEFDRAFADVSRPAQPEKSGRPASPSASAKKKPQAGSDSAPRATRPRTAQVDPSRQGGFSFFERP